MTETKFPVELLTSYVIEIFGNKEHANPLIMKNLSQKTKFHLRKLGEQLHKEEKRIRDQVIELRKELFEEKVAEDGQKYMALKEGKEQEWEEKIKELNAIQVPLLHYDFKESDFIDKATGDVVGSEGIYYNIIDKLIYDTPVAETAPLNPN